MKAKKNNYEANKLNRDSKVNIHNGNNDKTEGF